METWAQKVPIERPVEHEIVLHLSQRDAGVLAHHLVTGLGPGTQVNRKVIGDIVTTLLGTLGLPSIR